MPRKFIFIIDGEVGPDLTLEDAGEGPKFEANRALVAALSSNPIIMEIPSDSPIQMGWVWDGTNFIQPGE